LVTTGGESWLDESVQNAWLNCASLDVIAVHAYGTGDYAVSQIQNYVNRVKNAGKLMLFQVSCIFFDPFGYRLIVKKKGMGRLLFQYRE
jgi:hypothetical protein